MRWSSNEVELYRKEPYFIEVLLILLHSAAVVKSNRIVVFFMWSYLYDSHYMRSNWTEKIHSLFLY